jgi:hypothetical protein
MYLSPSGTRTIGPMLHLLAPELSATSRPEAAAFFEVAVAELGVVAQTTIIATLDHVIDAEFSDADGVVFFNLPRKDVEKEVEAMLARAAAAGAVILPVALHEHERRPPGTVGDRQSFDVVDHRRRRRLQEDQGGTVARAFAREALSKLQPTYTKDRLRIFLCHRREDGEGLAAAIGAALEVLHEHVFRDLVSVQASEEAQDRIDDALSTADVLVFLDTPRAGESWWIAHELSGALGRAIPIIWVRLGEPGGDRLALPVLPGPVPDVELTDLDPSKAEIRALADTILHKAFEAARAHVRSSQRSLRALQEWASENDAKFERLDARRLVFELSHSRSNRPYPTRPATDVIQVFARHPTDDDHDRLAKFLTEQEMGPHQRECRSFDAAVMLDPTATGERRIGDWSVVEHPDRFLGCLNSLKTNESAPSRPSLLLLGAFPADELSHQEVKSAVHAVATTWLRLGGALVFGGHPTFTPLVIEAARLVTPNVMRERVSVYQSEWFASPDVLNDLAGLVNVVPTAASTDRQRSLTVMRTKMIQPGSAAAVVSIGGRTTEGGTHVPGIDEEIALARVARIPVHLLGAPGGRTAELARDARAASEPWRSLGNRFDPTGNERLMQTDDYEQAAQSIWSLYTA